MTDLWTLSLLVLFLLFLATPHILWKYLSPVVLLIAVPLHILLTSLAKLLNNVPKIISFIVILIFSFLIFIFTYIVHFLGKFRTEDVITRIIEKSIGHHNITRVRKDILLILPDQGEPVQQSGLSELNTLRENAKSRMQSGELIFTIFIGVLFIFVPPISEIQLIFDVSFNTVAQIYVLFLTPAVLVRIYLINVLSFSSEGEAKDFGVDTSLAWQRAICTTNTLSIAAILLSFFIKTNETSYQNGLEILRLYLEEDIPLWKGIKQVHFG